MVQRLYAAILHYATAAISTDLDAGRLYIMDSNINKGFIFQGQHRFQAASGYSGFQVLNSVSTQALFCGSRIPSAHKHSQKSRPIFKTDLHIIMQINQLICSSQTRAKVLNGAFSAYTSIYYVKVFRPLLL